MSDETKALEAEQPKASAAPKAATATGAEWARRASTPRWQQAAARIVARLEGRDFDADLITETEFAAALERVA